jgi:hypothetical protein
MIEEKQKSYLFATALYLSLDTHVLWDELHSMYWGTSKSNANGKIYNSFTTASRPRLSLIS